MFVQQFFLKGIAHSSYLIGGKEECAIVDPRRDVEIYIEAARDMGYRITHILETHLHADFISGHMDLARKTGAVIVAPASGECTFSHKAVSEDSEFFLEHLRFRVIETPGHTPEGICYVVTDTSRGEEPCAIFTGDTLFVGDVGRPDLFPGIADELAEKLFTSIRKIFQLPDFVEVYPAHGAGSLCGKAMSGKRTSTIGYERRFNHSVQPSTLQEFKALLLNEMPAAPDHFSRCSATNRQGPVPLDELKKPCPLPPGEFNAFLQRGHLVLDLRTPAAFGGQHIPGSLHIDITSNFATFAGWLIPVDRPLLLVADRVEDTETSVIQLRRVGLDQIEGWLEGSLYRWALAGLPVASLAQVSVLDLPGRCKEGPFTLLDVRSRREFELFHQEKAQLCAAPDVRTIEITALREPVFCICNSGHRSSMAASILLSRGVKQVANVVGGVTAWAAAGYTTHCPLSQTVHGPQNRE